MTPVGRVELTRYLPGPIEVVRAPDEHTPTWREFIRRVRCLGCNVKFPDVPAWGEHECVSADH